MLSLLANIGKKLVFLFGGLVTPVTLKLAGKTLDLTPVSGLTVL
jgi:hypothetical protein